MHYTTITLLLFSSSYLLPSSSSSSAAAAAATTSAAATAQQRPVSSASVTLIGDDNSKFVIARHIAANDNISKLLVKAVQEDGNVATIALPLNSSTLKFIVPLFQHTQTLIDGFKNRPIPRTERSAYITREIAFEIERTMAVKWDASQPKQLNPIKRTLLTYMQAANALQAPILLASLMWQYTKLLHNNEDLIPKDPLLDEFGNIYFLNEIAKYYFLQFDKGIEQSLGTTFQTIPFSILTGFNKLPQPLLKAFPHLEQDPNGKNKQGETALSFAFSSPAVELQAIHALLRLPNIDRHIPTNALTKASNPAKRIFAYNLYPKEAEGQDYLQQALNNLEQDKLDRAFSFFPRMRPSQQQEFFTKVFAMTTPNTMSDDDKRTVLNHYQRALTLDPKFMGNERIPTKWMKTVVKEITPPTSSTNNDGSIALVATDGTELPISFETAHNCQVSGLIATALSGPANQTRLQIQIQPSFLGTTIKGLEIIQQQLKANIEERVIVKSLACRLNTRNILTLIQDAHYLDAPLLLKAALYRYAADQSHLDDSDWEKIRKDLPSQELRSQYAQMYFILYGKSIEYFLGLPNKKIPFEMLKMYGCFSQDMLDAFPNLGTNPNEKRDFIDVTRGGRKHASALSFALLNANDKDLASLLKMSPNIDPYATEYTPQLGSMGDLFKKSEDIIRLAFAAGITVEDGIACTILNATGEPSHINMKKIIAVLQTTHPPYHLSYAKLAQALFLETKDWGRHFQPLPRSGSDSDDEGTGEGDDSNNIEDFAEQLSQANINAEEMTPGDGPLHIITKLIHIVNNKLKQPNLDLRTVTDIHSLQNILRASRSDATRDHQNSQGNTALILAVEAGDEDWITLLLDDEADPTIRNAQGQTAFQKAVTLTKSGKIKLSKELIERLRPRQAASSSAAAAAAGSATTAAAASK
jgi:hypothetical protein